jgi:hypothetical protein
VAAIGRLGGDAHDLLSVSAASNAAVSTSG